MNEATVAALASQAISVALKVSLPVLLTALVVGVLVSVLQAATQIQELTLTFVPKLLAIAAVLLLAGSWMASTLTGFAREMFAMLPLLAK
ncbi:MAG: flagellar biosynthesis protein FliQ [Firmicutes bacterium]|jgi:flagellar biosynthetic protein FliQ|nr:flagellar biosynthesis protein FliQ [Bacillota bacterium]MDD4792814.1 flagellar biosynthesis protein FliQ [Bacillota bacterium]